MPAITECPKCKRGEENHGFTGFPYGLRFYHDGPNGHCEWYSLRLDGDDAILGGYGKSQIFLTHEDAVTAVHGFNPGRFHSEWVRYMLGKSYLACPECHHMMEPNKYCDTCRRRYPQTRRHLHR